MPQSDSMTLPQQLREDIEHAGYLPALVTDVVATAVAGDEIVGHLVHPETTLDEEAVRRHVTGLVLTPHRLVIGHADDHESSEPQGHFSTATPETVPLSAARAVTSTHVRPH